MGNSLLPLRGLLTQSFRNAAGTPAGQVLARHFSKAATVFYCGGNAILLLKNGVRPDIDAAIGAAFMLSAAGMWFGNKTTWGFKVAGYMTLLGGALMLAGAWDKPAFAAQTIGTRPFFLSGTLMAKATPSNQNGAACDIVTANPLKRYPVLSGATGQFLARPFLIYSAFQRGDIGWIAAALSWGAGDLCLGGSDPRVQENIKKLDPENKKTSRQPV